MSYERTGTQIDPNANLLGAAANIIKVLLNPEDAFRKKCAEYGRRFGECAESWAAGKRKDAAELVERLVTAKGEANADHLRRMLDEIESPLGAAELSHVTSRWTGDPGVSTKITMVYQKDAQSPTKCLAFGGVDWSPEVDAYLEKRGQRAGDGPQRGPMSEHRRTV